MWLKEVFADCGLQHEERIKINCDNKSYIAIAQNLVLHGRIKHVDVKFHHIKDLILEKIVSLNYCSSEDQVANIMTKCLDGKKFLKFWEMLGVSKLQSSGKIIGFD